MKKQNLVIVGGGSTYTLGIIMSLIEEKKEFPLKKITFYDNDEVRQSKIARASEVILREHYPELESFTYTTNKEEAFKDIDIAYIQIGTTGRSRLELDGKIP